MKTPPQRVRSRRGGEDKSSVAGAEYITSPNRLLFTPDEPALQVVTVGSFQRVDGIAALVIARILLDGTY